MDKQSTRENVNAANGTAATTPSPLAQEDTADPNKRTLVDNKLATLRKLVSKGTIPFQKGVLFDPTSLLFF